MVRQTIRKVTCGGLSLCTADHDYRDLGVRSEAALSRKALNSISSTPHDIYIYIRTYIYMYIYICNTHIYIYMVL